MRMFHRSAWLLDIRSFTSSEGSFLFEPMAKSLKNEFLVSSIVQPKLSPYDGGLY